MFLIEGLGINRTVTGKVILTSHLNHTRGRREFIDKSWVILEARIRSPGLWFLGPCSHVHYVQDFAGLSLLCCS